MNIILKKTIVFLMILGVSCSSSSDDDFTNTPPLNNTPNEPASYEIKMLTDNFGGEEFVVVGSEGWNFMVAFKTNLNGKDLSFEVIPNSLPLLIRDNEGSQYNIFGRAVDGPSSGEQLTPMNAFIGYWFSWGTFYPGLEIYESTMPLQNAGASVQGSDDWLIPREQVFTGALRDAIPAIDNPDFAGSSNNFTDNDLVIVVCHNGEYKAYPHLIMNWHEIVNDAINNYYFSVVFCPLTGTATVWNRQINGEITTFGVSGFLYNSNVVPYDRKTNSNWSQMLQLCVQGELKEAETNNLFVLETSIETWKEIASGGRILSTNTGFSRNYNANPYGSYPTNSTVNFPVNFADTRLHPKERVLGIIVDGAAKAYRFESFK